ncbi:hypothetical protein SLEP1_g39988 [Rubroshorea leprosula]|uniref:Uncharacterized protein n=1 Tax=Rubroshorea leprosula TaxID=152421 RepID=A0AAV5L280_9ROSI|nr:hypothetical protein SLEP1_g39988 [Rubroshorea leprosula]
MVEARRPENSWARSEQSSGVEMNGRDLSVLERILTDRDGCGVSDSQAQQKTNNASDTQLGIAERAFSAAGAAFLSAIIVNPLDVAKVIR